MQTLNYKKNKAIYVLLYLAYISLTIFTSYPAKLSISWNSAFDLAFFVFFVSFLACLLIYNWRDIKGIRVHIVSLLIILRFILFFINVRVLDLSFPYVLQEFLMSFFSVLIFTYAFNFVSNEKEEIKNVLTFFTVVVSAQLLLHYVSKDFNINKNKIVAGIGYSNYCATFLLLGVSYLLFVKTNLFQKFVVGLGVIALIMTESFGGATVLLIVAIIAIVTKMNWKSKKSWLIFLFAFNLCILGLIFFFNTSLGQPAWKRILGKFTYLTNGDYKNLGSSRVFVFKTSLENIKEHPWFGPIVNIINSSSGRIFAIKTHNIFLESLLNYGIVGTIINVLIVVLLVFGARKTKNKGDGYRGAIVSVIAVLIHGLVEPNFFTLHFEMFLWLIIGSMLNTSDTKNVIVLPVCKKKRELKTEK